MSLLSFLLVDINQQHVNIYMCACSNVNGLSFRELEYSKNGCFVPKLGRQKAREHNVLQVNSSFSLGFSIIPLITTLMR